MLECQLHLLQSLKNNNTFVTAVFAGFLALLRTRRPPSAVAAVARVHSRYGAGSVLLRDHVMQVVLVVRTGRRLEDDGLVVMVVVVHVVVVMRSVVARGAATAAATATDGSVVVAAAAGTAAGQTHLKVRGGGVQLRGVGSIGGGV